MTKRQLKITGILFIILLVSMSVCLAAPGTGINTGQSMPQFSLQALDGSQITVTPGGKVLILNFWATWCPPCRQEMPELNNYYLQNSDKVVFYTINLQEPQDKVNAFLYNNNYSMPTLLDAKGAVANLFQIRYIPTTIIVDKDGVIQFRKSGAITLDELTNAVNPLL